MTTTTTDWADVGRRAYIDGRNCIPISDPAVLNAIGMLPVGGGSAEIMQAWTRGWTEANLAAPVDELAGPVEGADPCPQGCEPIRLRNLNEYEDECIDCGRTGPRDDFDHHDTED